MLTHKLPLSWISLHESFISFSSIMSVYSTVLCTNNVDVTVITEFNLTLCTHFQFLCSVSILDSDVTSFVCLI